jgi:hypothetical protein
MDIEPDSSKHIVSLEPVHCGFKLASAKWNRIELVRGLMRATDPPNWIERDDAEALADAITAATGQNVPELRDRHA